MTNLNMTATDRYMLRHAIRSAVNRREFLAPFPLRSDDIIEAQLSPAELRLVRELQHSTKGALNLFTRFTINNVRGCAIELITHKEFPAVEGPNRLSHGALNHQAPRYFDVVEWAELAIGIEKASQRLGGILEQIINRCTTHKQVYRYMPEFYALATSMKADNYSMTRIVEVHDILKQQGAKRAAKQVIEGVSIEDRIWVRDMVAQMILLPVDPYKDTDYVRAWVNLK